VAVAVACTAGSGVGVTEPAGGVWVGVAVAPSWANTTLKLAEAKTKMTSSEIALNPNDLAAIQPPYIQLSSA
jgi:nicotinamide mononucleotide (NMN) deamidase PncC